MLVRVSNSHSLQLKEGYNVKEVEITFAGFPEQYSLSSPRSLKLFITQITVVTIYGNSLCVSWPHSQATDWNETLKKLQLSVHALQWAMNRPCLYLYFNFTHSSMVVTINVYCTYVPTPSLLISLTLLAVYSKRQVCVWPCAPYMCAVLELVPGNIAYCMAAVLKLPCGMRTHSCGCGALNEVSELIGRWQYPLMWYV